MPAASDNTASGKLQAQLEAQVIWRRRAMRALHTLRSWLREANAESADSDTRLGRALAAIESNRFTLIVAGTEQRSRTELINALFFAEFGRHLLPLRPNADGCPLEIAWQPGDGDACLRLLPIESAQGSETLDALKADPERWVSLPFGLREPRQMNAALAELNRTKPLSVARAQRLGLRIDPAAAATGTCAVSCWRYAMLGFPHPLLRKGLTLLELPDLAAIERDDALKALLERADALLLSLSAAPGAVTEALRLARSRPRSTARRPFTTLVAVTRSERSGGDNGSQAAQLERSAQRTATALGLERGQVVVVSPRDGLAAKIAGKPSRLHASGIEVLEARLAEALVARFAHACRQRVQAHISALLQDTRAGIAKRATEVETRIAELQELDARCTNLLTESRARIRSDAQAYARGVELVRRTQRALNKRARQCRELLGADNFERLAAQARAELNASSGTPGLRRTVSATFDELRRIVALTGNDTAAVAHEMQLGYSELQRDLGLELAVPRAPALARYRLEMDLLHEEAIRFARSGGLLISPRSSVVRQFERRLMQRARVLFEHLREDWYGWIDAAPVPLVAEVERRKALAERRLERLQVVEATRDDASAERTALASEQDRLATQVARVGKIRKALGIDFAAQSPGARGPYLVASHGEPVRRSG